MRINIEEAKKVFERYLRMHNIHWSQQRDQILETFLRVKGHLTVDEIYTIVKKRYPSVGYATVHRAMRVICDSGIGEGVKFGNGAVRYELLYGHGLHYHLVCTKCYKVIEATNPAIEALQEEMARSQGFIPTCHRLLIYGTCRACAAQPASFQVEADAVSEEPEILEKVAEQVGV